MSTNLGRIRLRLYPSVKEIARATPHPLDEVSSEDSILRVTAYSWLPRSLDHRPQQDEADLQFYPIRLHCWLSNATQRDKLPTGYKAVRVIASSGRATGIEDFLTGFLQGATTSGRVS